MSSDDAALSLPDAKRVAPEFDMDRVFNAMPHALHMTLPSGAECTVGTSGVVLRLTEAEAAHLLEDPVLVVAPPTYTGIEGEMGKIPVGAAVLVSMLVGEYLRNNGLPPELAGCTIYSPATGTSHAVRSATGAIIGTKALTRWV